MKALAFCRFRQCLAVVVHKIFWILIDIILDLEYNINKVDTVAWKKVESWRVCQFGLAEINDSEYVEPYFGSITVHGAALSARL